MNTEDTGRDTGRPLENVGAAGDDDAKAVEEELESEVEVAIRERDEYLDMLRRVQADFENYKKRMMRQQTELLDKAAQGLVQKLLPALDALDLARVHLTDSKDTKGLSEEGKALLQATALLFDTLNKEGLERVDDTGAEFDPMTHDAVEHVSSEEETETPKGEPGTEDLFVIATGAGATEPGGVQNAGAGVGPTGPTVVSVLRPGYKWKGRVIRPAMVKVRG